MPKTAKSAKKSNSRRGSSSTSSSNKTRPLQVGGQSALVAEDAKEAEQRKASVEPILWDLLRASHPLVWCSSTSGYHVRRVVLRDEESDLVLVKKVNANGFVVVDANRINEAIPEDLTEADAETFKQDLNKLLVSNFEVQARVNDTEIYYSWGRPYTRHIDREIVVSRFTRSPYNGSGQYLRVQEAGNPKWFIVAANSLRAVGVADTSAKAEDLMRAEKQLALSENMAKRLENDLTEAQNELSATQNEKQGLERQVDDYESRLAAQKSKADQFSRETQRLTKTTAHLRSEIAGLESSLTSARATIKDWKRQMKREEDANESLRGEKGALERQRDQQTRTIENLEKKIAVDQSELLRLRQDLDQAYRQIGEYRDETRVFQQQSQELQNAREKIQKLVDENRDIQSRLSEVMGRNLLQEYRGYDFGKEMAELRDQKLEDAVEAASTILDLEDEDASKLMFKIFKFVYQFSQDRLAGILDALHVSGNDALERLFIIKLQDSYAQTFDSCALENAFLEAFGPELGDAASHAGVLEYVRKSGEICWCVVIRLEPKLHFMPTEQVESDVMFDSTQFKDITCKIRKGDTAQIVAYVLPGLYRVDANAPVSPDARPCVYPKKIRKIAGANKTEAPTSEQANTEQVARNDVVASSARSRGELKQQVEEEIWNGNVEDAKAMLKQLRVNTWDIEICCGEDGCDAVLFKGWHEYERMSKKGGACECPRDEDHMNVAVRKKWGRPF